MNAPAVVFVLCFLTAGACSLLLARAYRRSAARLLLWAALAFGFLALNNFILVLDALVFPGVDLRPHRLVSALAAVGVLLYAFIWGDRLMDDRLFAFLSGLIAAGFLVAAMFFLRFWARTRDRLFLAFAVAFVLLAANQALSGLLEAALEERTWTYLLRLAGFSVLIVAILGKTFEGGEKKK